MKTRQEGFTIAEVVVSMVLLGIVLTTLAGLVHSTAVQAIKAQDITTRTAATLEIVNRYTSMPFGSLTSACDTTGAVGAQYSRCATVVTDFANQRTVTIAVKPLQRDTTTESVTFIRSFRNASNPLCLGC